MLDAGAPRGRTVEEVLEAQEATASYEAISLDTPVVPRDDESATMVDLMGGADPGYDLVARRDAIAGAGKTLPEIVRTVLELRFSSDLTQREIGERTAFADAGLAPLAPRAEALGGGRSRRLGGRYPSHSALCLCRGTSGSSTGLGGCGADSRRGSARPKRQKRRHGCRTDAGSGTSGKQS